MKSRAEAKSRAGAKTEAESYEAEIARIDWAKGQGLVPAVVQHGATGRVLMLGYVNEESLRATLAKGLVTFFSRSRNSLWTKGETSGNFLRFRSLAVDCDGDTLLIQAEPGGPVCHQGTETCFPAAAGSARLDFLGELSQVIDERFAAAGERKSSYVAQLIESGLDRMAQKVGEEAVETIIAAKNTDLPALEGEAADLLFHLMVLLKARGSSLGAVSETLRKRHAAKASR